MIFWFSGTGNSEFTAKEIARLTDDTAVSIPDILKGKAEKPDYGKLPVFGVVFPVYAWRSPRYVTDFLKSIKLSKDAYCFAVCTCGDEAGKSIDDIKKLLPLSLGYSVSMPNNYIVGGDIDSETVIKEKLDNAKLRVAEIASHINNRDTAFDVKEGSKVFLKSSVINFGFVTFATNSKPFYAEDTCISCGICEAECPVSNIVLIDGKPKWDNKCIQCLRCINICPQKAIQYGKATKERGRYICPETDGK